MKLSRNVWKFIFSFTIPVVVAGGAWGVWFLAGGQHPEPLAAAITWVVGTFAGFSILGILHDIA